jgi:hypothetical protein
VSMVQMALDLPLWSWTCFRGQRAKPGLDEPPGSLCVFEEQALGFLPELDSG